MSSGASGNLSSGDLSGDESRSSNLETESNGEIYVRMVNMLAELREDLGALKNATHVLEDARKTYGEVIRQLVERTTRTESAIPDLKNTVDRHATDLNESGTRHDKELNESRLGFVKDINELGRRLTKDTNEQGQRLTKETYEKEQRLDDRIKNLEHLAYLAKVIGAVLLSSAAAWLLGHFVHL
jgi:SMC interacting uncharacterized protein involved in chromosome segregation